MRIRELFAHPLPGTRVSTPLGLGTMRGIVTDPRTDNRTATHYLIYLDASPSLVSKVPATDVYSLME